MTFSFVNWEDESIDEPAKSNPYRKSSFEASTLLLGILEIGVKLMELLTYCWLLGWTWTGISVWAMNFPRIVAFSPLPR